MRKFTILLSKAEFQKFYFSHRWNDKFIKTNFWLGEVFSLVVEMDTLSFGGGKFETVFFSPSLDFVDTKLELSLNAGVCTATGI